MDKQYEQYCMVDHIFYDAPRQQRTLFSIAERPLPDGWHRSSHGDWLVNIPPGPPPAAQGWKIHVSACLDNADEVITRVWQYCVPRGIHFKFLGSRLAVLMRNAKYASRSASGKAVTVYPADEAACERILRELSPDLAGQPGPYILSDLRYGAGPLYVRYGGFARRCCLDARGELVPAIENPDGELVPDQRSAVFTVPEWGQLPQFLTPHLAARNSVAMTDLDYELTGALHFSNGGGVYTATDKRTGDQVILKEARPYAGLGADGSDAVSRLHREHDALLRLSGLGIAPEVRSFFRVGEHQFLAEEFISGRTLNSFFAQRYPLGGQVPDPAATKAYTAWALRICDAVERAVAAIHERGVVFNDLHMFNIIVRSDDSVALIDFEAASDIGEGRVRTVGNPGFAAPRDRTGFDVDAYSLACLRLAMFMPLTTLLPLDPGKAAQFASAIAGLFPVPEQFLDAAVREITRGRGQAGPDQTAPGVGATAPGATAGVRAEPRTGVTAGVRTEPRTGVTAGVRTEPRTGVTADDAGGQANWDRWASGLVDAILASATPERADRLFPGDIDQFRVPGGGLGLAHGAAGVLYALSEAVGGRVPEYEEWLISRAADPPDGTHLGLYDGLAGVAYTLARLGHLDAAVRTARGCLAENWERLGPGLYGGLSGFALALLSVADLADEPELAAAGLRAAQIVAAPYASAGASVGGPVGLMRGASGKALLFIRLYERTGDPAYLDAAERAIAADLDRCVTDRHGALQVDEGWRTLPYLAGGSAGVGMVIGQFTAHRANPAFAGAARAIRLAASSGFYVQAGLFNGRAGMIAYLAERSGGNGPQAAGSDVSASIDRLAWHAVRHADGLAFPGDMLLRLSMDLATGTAGVLLGTAAALAPRGAALPFFAQPPSLPGRVPGSSPAAVQGADNQPALARR